MKLWWVGPAIGIYMLMTKKQEEKKKPVKKPIAPAKPVVIAVNEQTDEDSYEMD